MSQLEPAMLESVIHQVANARLGKTLRGRWTLEKLVGVGGMAAVYEARHRNGQRFAIKILHPTLAINDDVRARFVQEGQVASRIRHSGIVRVVDDDIDDDGAPFLVMDLIEGGDTLAKKIFEGRFDDEQLLDVAEQVCSVLAAAHEAGVIHRDLKPDNLIVDGDGRVRVLDFGIARFVEPGEEMSALATQTGMAFGTPGFISPEQALGHRERIGPATDIYALGATLFYLATGEFVHDADTPQELLIYVATKPPRSLVDCAQHVSPEIAALVDRATRMDVAERWQSAQSMLGAIRRIRAARRSDRASLASIPMSTISAPVLPPPPEVETLADQSAAPARAASSRRSSVSVVVSGIVDIPTRPSISRRVVRRNRSVVAGITATAALFCLFSFLTTRGATQQAEAATATLQAAAPAEVVAAQTGPVAAPAAAVSEPQIAVAQPGPPPVVVKPVAKPVQKPRPHEVGKAKLIEALSKAPRK